MDGGSSALGSLAARFASATWARSHASRPRECGSLARIWRPRAAILPWRPRRAGRISGSGDPGNPSATRRNACTSRAPSSHGLKVSGKTSQQWGPLEPDGNVIVAMDREGFEQGSSPMNGRPGRSQSLLGGRGLLRGAFAFGGDFCECEEHFRADCLAPASRAKSSVSASTTALTSRAFAWSSAPSRPEPRCAPWSPRHRRAASAQTRACWRGRRVCHAFVGCQSGEDRFSLSGCALRGPFLRPDSRHHRLAPLCRRL